MSPPLDPASRAAVPVRDAGRGAGRRGSAAAGAPALRRDPRRGAARNRAAADPVVGAADQPVPAGDDQSGRGEGDLAQFGLVAGVLAPQSADDVHRLLRGGGELQSGVDGRAGVESEVLGGEPAAEAAGEDLGDQRRGGAAGLLAAQPAGDRGLVVAQVESVLEAELVDAAGEARVGEARFGDECGEPAIGRALRGSIRHAAVRSTAFGRAFGGRGWGGDWRGGPGTARM